MEILINGEYGVLATNGEDGYNYATALNYVYINDKIYFHCATEGHKLDNIKVNNKVSFCVVGKTQVVPNKFTSNDWWV
ncbi:pyridoxamine 5'-phosphate oxidase family protein [Clostridium sp. WILCCON 0269]|uniref:Pyridoxamine 5'-phosphate oxidase family protein n=1 Tax=Candidatus Clostridium eludens TaxID=3381663 RepID=A0ABW8SQ04_9CLOT